MGAIKATANQIRERLHGQLRERFGAEDTYVWIEDFDPDENWVVFEISPDDGAPTTWRLGYSSDGETVTLDSGEPTEVVRTVDYAPKAAELTGPIVRKDAAKRIAYGAVLVPGEPDSDGEVLTADKIEEVAHTWLSEFRALDRQHSVKQIDANPVESYLEPADRDVEVDGETLTLPAGTWVMAAKINDDETWGEVEDGTRTGFSIMGVPRASIAAAVSAVKSGDVAALKRVTLADVGGGDANGDWVAPFVSIVDAPAVPKAKFFAIKQSGPNGTDRGLWQRFASWLSGESAAAKEGRRYSEQTYKRLQEAAEAVNALLAEAESERTTRAGKAHDEEIEVDRKEIQEAVSESVTGAVKSALDDALAEVLKPINERLDKVDPPEDPAEKAAEAVKAALADAGADVDGDQLAEAVKAALTPDPQPGSGGDLAAAVKEAIAPLIDKVERVEKRTRPGSLQPDDGVDLDPVFKNAPERDAFGRPIA